MQSLVQAKGFRDTLLLAGGQNKYQVQKISILILQLFFRAFFILYYPFINQPPLFKCNVDPNDPNNYDICTENMPGGCDVPKDLREFAPESPKSLTVELGLYCEYNYVRTLASTLFFFAGNIGAGVFSYLSDSQGRKSAMSKAYLLGSVGMLLLGLVAPIHPLIYIACIMFIWFNFSCYCTICATYVAEICNEKYGKDATLVMLIGTVVPEILIVVIAYFIPSWKVVLLVFIVLPALLSNFSFKFLDETPAYLCGKRDWKRAAEVFENIAQINGVKVDAEATPVHKMSVKKVEQAAPTRQWNYIQILMHPQLRLRVLVFSVLKFYLTLSFYGCLFALSGLGGSIYSNSIVACVAEGMGYVFAFKAYLFTTSKLLKGSLQLVIAAGVSFLFIPALENIISPFVLQGILIMIMRTALCFISGFAFNLGNEIFPAEVRCQSIGVSEIFSAMGGMVAPFIILAAEVNNLNPLFLLGSMGMLALTACKYLPESQITSLDEKPAPAGNNDVEMSYVRMNDKN